MIRAFSELERSVVKALCGHATDEYVDQCRIEPQNDDGTILDIHLPASVVAGNRVVELAHGVFKDHAEAIRGFVLLLGDERGNPRQLDFHGLDEGMSVYDLTSLQLVAL